MICEECNKEKAMHWICKSGVEQNLCCKCYMSKGNTPSDWHPICMNIYRETLSPKKYHKGDYIKIDDNYSSEYAGNEGIVITSYSDKYGTPDDGGDYTVHIKGKGQVSWFTEKSLTLIEFNRIDKLLEWEAEAEAERKEKSDLDWIFAHGQDVLQNTHGSSIQSLADCLGISNLWGSRGEGFVYYQNAMAVLNNAAPYLIAGDKIGWLKHCEKLKLKKRIDN